MEHFEFISKVLYIGKPVFGDPVYTNHLCIVTESQVFIYDSVDELLDDFRSMLLRSI